MFQIMNHEFCTCRFCLDICTRIEVGLLWNTLQILRHKDIKCSFVFMILSWMAWFLQAKLKESQYQISPWRSGMAASNATQSHYPEVNLILNIWVASIQDVYLEPVFLHRKTMALNLYHNRSIMMEIYLLRQFHLQQQIGISWGVMKVSSALVLWKHQSQTA